MGLAPPRAVAVTAAVSVLLLVGMGGAEALAAKAPTAKSSLKSLVRQTNSLPPAAASPAKRRALKRLAAHARRSRAGVRAPRCATSTTFRAHPGERHGQDEREQQAPPRRAAPERTRPGLRHVEPAAAGEQAHAALRRRCEAAGGRQPQGQGHDERRRSGCGSVWSFPRSSSCRARRAGRPGRSSCCRTPTPPAQPGTPGIPVVSDVLGRAGRRKIQV